MQRLIVFMFLTIFCWIVFASEEKTPYFQFVEDCGGDAISQFKITGGKKVNLKKPLNGKMVIQVETSDFRSTSDALKMKKCIQFDETSRLFLNSVREVSAEFVENVPRNEFSVKFVNGTKKILNLDQNGVSKGTVQYFDSNGEPTEIIQDGIEEKWTYFIEGKFWKFSQKFSDNFQLLSDRKFHAFYLCKFVNPLSGWGSHCLKSGKIKEFGKGFYFQDENSKIELKPEFEVDLQKETIHLHENNYHKKMEFCQLAKTNLTNWLYKIHSDFSTDPKMDKEDLLTILNDQTIKLDFSEFAKYDTKPEFFELSQYEVPIVREKIEYPSECWKGNCNENLGVVKLKTDAILDPAPVMIKVYSEKFSESKKQEKQGLFINGNSMNSETQPLSIIHSYLCKNGKLCGIVKKLGRRLRQPICQNYALGQLSYFAYHDPKTGNIQGPSYNFLLGDSILYSPDGKYPGTKIAYIYKGSSTAIRGHFDQNKMLEKGQKVNFEFEECDSNGIPRLKFSEPLEPEIFYHYKPPTIDAFGDQPHVPDEVAMDHVEVKFVNDFMGDGLYAKKDIPDGTLILQYGGFRFRNAHEAAQKPSKYHDSTLPYAHMVGFCEELRVDIPKGFYSAKDYNATLAHKTNNKFMPNTHKFVVDSARFGLIGAFFANGLIKKGQDLSSYYGYQHVEHLDRKWYSDQWEDFKKQYPGIDWSRYMYQNMFQYRKFKKEVIDALNK